MVNKIIKRNKRKMSVAFKDALFETNGWWRRSYNKGAITYRLSE
jgi:hypothetical protein